MVIAHQSENAAVFRRACEIGVAKDVARTINARPFAVPHAKYAIEFAFASEFSLLAAPQRGRREFLVNPRLELDIGSRNLPHSPHELLIEPAKRGTAIAGDVASRMQAGTAVALFLHEAGADQRLIARHEDV